MGGGERGIAARGHVGMVTWGQGAYIRGPEAQRLGGSGQTTSWPVDKLTSWQGRHARGNQGRGATVSRPWVPGGRVADASLPCAAKPRAVSGKRLAVGRGIYSGFRSPLERIERSGWRVSVLPSTQSSVQSSIQSSTQSSIQSSSLRQPNRHPLTANRQGQCNPTVSLYCFRFATFSGSGRMMACPNARP